MSKLYYIVEDGQSLFDVSLVLFGHQDGVFLLLRENRGLNLGPLYGGQKLWYTPQILNKQVLELYTRRNYKPATSGSMSDVPPPPPAPDPDMVVIQQYGLDDIQVEAPAVITIAPSVIKNAITGEVIATLAPGQEYPVIVFSGIDDQGPPYTVSVIDNP